ncbi:F/Y-rich family protein [Aphelenchoides avenae]|nr:F/Y-rich family protein [Aphelenchus avenae]
MLSKPVAEHLSHALSHSLGYMYTDPSSSYHRSISVDDDDYEEYQPYQPSGRGRGRGGGRGRLLKLGIGGFSARIPRHKLNLPGNEEEGAGDEVMRQGEAVQQKKRMRKPRRPEMEDVYPAAIQEAFFGTTAVDGKSLLEQVVDEPILGEFKKESLDIQINKTGCELSEQSADALRSEQEKDMLGEILVDENEMDIDNLDLNLFDLEDDDVDFPDDSTLDDSLNDGFPSTSDLASGIASPSFAFTGDGSMNAMAMMQQHHERQRMMQQQNRAGVVGAVQRSVSHTEPTNAEKVNQATERWEEDEPLGENATKAPVLFANVCHKDLKERFPNWPQRAKAINRLWRSLTAEKRQEYVNRARMNRANSTRKRVRRTATSENVEMTAEAISAKIMELSQQRSAGAAQQAQVVQKPTVVNPAQMGMPGVMPANIHPMQQLPPGMPPTPGGSGTSPTVAAQFQVPQSVPVTPSATFPEQHPMEAVFHLDPKDLDAYEQLRQRLLDLQKEQGGHDTELARLRKIKKTLATKRRQLNKGLVDANGAPLPPVELSDTETACFDEAVRAIPLRQKQQEVCKNAIKQQMERLRDFEQQHNIGPLRSPSSQATVASGQGISPPFTHPQMLSLSAPQSALQSPSVSMNNFAYPRQYRPPLHMASMGSLVSGMHSPMPLRLEMDQLSQSSGPPTPSSGRPASSASVEMQQAPKSNRGRKRKKPLPEMRSPVLGNVIFATLTSDLDKDVYDTVDSLVQRVCMHIDGIPLMPVGGSRLPSMESESAPKQKRKRQVLKKPPSYDTNEYELMNDRIQTQLKPFAPVLIEPSQAYDRLQKHYGDVTALPERAGHPNYVNPFVGECRLTFMEDYYENVERRMPVDLESMLPPFMEDVYGKDVLRALMQ